MEALFIYIVGPLSLMLIGGIAGRVRERRHLVELDQREAERASLLVTDLRQMPPGMVALQGTMVMGEVVIATDYFKRFLASIRSLIGGEVQTLQPVMARGRREARLRMLDEAAGHGADMVINVRFETSIVVNGAAEVLCFGTAVRTR